MGQGITRPTSNDTTPRPEFTGAGHGRAEVHADDHRNRIIDYNPPPASKPMQFANVAKDKSAANAAANDRVKQAQTRATEEIVKEDDPFKIKMLQYPTTVDQMQDGHYIIFQIHKITPPKFKPRPTINDIPTPSVRMGSNDQAGSKFAEHVDHIKKQNEQEQQRLLAAESLNKSQHTLHNGTKTVATQISLYMPPSVQVSYKSNYEDGKMGVVSGNLARFIDAGGFYNKFDVGKEIASEISARVIGAAADTLLPGFRGLNEISQGKILSDRMELFFKGVGRRSFQYTFVFVPKSEQEAIDVDAIVHEFKTAMLPKYTNGFKFALDVFETKNDRILTIPTTFDIKYYMHVGGGGMENGFLNKISTCFLTDAQVTYGGDKFSAHRFTSTNRTRGSGVEHFGAPPQRTTLALTFNEIEIITQESARAGY